MTKRSPWSSSNGEREASFDITKTRSLKMEENLMLFMAKRQQVEWTDQLLERQVGGGGQRK